MARLSALIAAIAALAVAPVQAATFASASLTDFRITLLDLGPADGIAPSIAFMGTDGFGKVVARDTQPIPSEKSRALPAGRST